jgi:hypothetical protein
MYRPTFVFSSSSFDGSFMHCALKTRQLFESAEYDKHKRLIVIPKSNQLWSNVDQKTNGHHEIHSSFAIKRSSSTMTSKSPAFVQCSLPQPKSRKSAYCTQPIKDIRRRLVYSYTDGKQTPFSVEDRSRTHRESDTRPTPSIDSL